MIFLTPITLILVCGSVGTQHSLPVNFVPFSSKTFLPRPVRAAVWVFTAALGLMDWMRKWDTVAIYGVSNVIGAATLLLMTSGLNPANATKAYAIGPSTTPFQGTASVINIGNAQAQSQVTLPGLQSGFTNFEIINGEIWGVDGSTAMRRWTLDGTSIGASGLFDPAVDLEVVGNQVYAIGPSSTTAFQGTASVINIGNAQAQSQVTLSGLQSGFTNFEIINGEIWGVDGSTAMRRWALDGTSIGVSGLFGSSVDLEPIPIPPTVWLFCSALGWLGWSKKRRSMSENDLAGRLFFITYR